MQILIDVNNDVQQSDEESVIKKPNKKRKTGPSKLSIKGKVINIDEPESNDCELSDQKEQLISEKRNESLQPLKNIQVNERKLDLEIYIMV